MRASEARLYCTVKGITDDNTSSGTVLTDPADIIKSVKRGLYAVQFGGGQVDITNGKFVFSASEAYLIEDGQVTAPERIGYLPASAGSWSALTVQQNLDLHAKLFGLEDDKGALRIAALKEQ